jgi:hypothetical protein
MPTRGPEIMKFGHLRETDNAAGSCKPEREIAGAGVASLRKQQPASVALLNSLWGREKLKFEHLGKTKDLAATSAEASGSGREAYLSFRAVY